METLWPRVLDLIKTDVSVGSFQRWFGNILRVERRGNTFFLTVPNELACDYMEKQFSQLIKNSIYSLSGEELNVSFLNHEALSAPAGFSPVAAAIGATPSEKESFGQKENGFAFNPRYTFDSFVVGNSNRFAHAAALAVAEKPARTYNPLFIYGGSGLGKTHLMHAVGRKVLQKNPQAKVIYISTESFTNEFISLIRAGKAYTFKNRYRNADVFLVDDIQFLTGKEGTQEEFFHTFNALHEAGKQIVISSDRPPKEILTLEDRLRSRFEWGLITDIQMPDLETRIAILQRKADNEKVTVNDEVFFFIAEQIRTNIRELEGALNTVIYFAAVNNIKTIDLPSAKKALEKIILSDKKPPLTIEHIQRTVAAFFELRADELKSKKRNREVVVPRQLAMYLCRLLTKHSLQEIGAAFGGRDHGTVIHAVKTVENMMEQDTSALRSVEFLKSQLAR